MRAQSGPVASERRNVPLVNVPTIIVTGPVGVGKTTVAEEMGMLLLAAKVPHATVDFDQLTACYPRPADDDRWGTKLGLMNLAALWKNYERSGARRLLLAFAERGFRLVKLFVQTNDMRFDLTQRGA